MYIEEFFKKSDIAGRRLFFERKREFDPGSG